MSDVPQMTPIVAQLIAMDKMGETCPKALGGGSFRAPATLLDHCSGKVHATVDFTGAGYDYTLAP